MLGNQEMTTGQQIASCCAGCGLFVCMCGADVGFTALFAEPVGKTTFASAMKLMCAVGGATSAAICVPVVAIACGYGIWKACKPAESTDNEAFALLSTAPPAQPRMG